MMKYRKREWHRGFSIVGLLACALLILFLSAMAVKNLRKTVVGVGLEEQGNVYRKIFEPADGKECRAKVAQLDELSLDNNCGMLGFRISGSKPHRAIEVYRNGGWSVSAGNVYDMRFTYYDARSLMLDEEAAASPKEVRRVRVSILYHSGSEKKDYFLNDGTYGADLDGDPTNGTAKLAEVAFVLDLD